jgi:hypothetical protein
MDRKNDRNRTERNRLQPDHRLRLLTLSTRLGCRLPKFQNIQKPSKNRLESVATGFFMYIPHKNNILLKYSLFFQQDRHLAANASGRFFQTPLQHPSNDSNRQLWHHPPTATIATTTADHEQRTNEGPQPMKATNDGQTKAHSQRRPMQVHSRELWWVIGLKRRVVSFEPRYVFFLYLSFVLTYIGLLYFYYDTP